VIRFDDVSVTYRGGVQALRNVDLRVNDGEFVVVVGLSGAGKSTLLRALNGLVPATSGSITIDGTEVVGAGAAELRVIRSRIGMIFQTFNLVHRTSVLNNVLMGRLSAVPAWRSLLGSGRPPSARRPSRPSSGWVLSKRHTCGPPTCPADSSSGWASLGP